MFNLSVEGCPEFFANGILVHNCSYGINTWRQNSEKPARTALAEEIAELKREGMDDTSLSRIAWQRELKIREQEKQKEKGIRLSRSLDAPSKR